MAGCRPVPSLPETWTDDLIFGILLALSSVERLMDDGEKNEKRGVNSYGFAFVHRLHHKQL